MNDKPVILYIHGFGSMYDKNNSKCKHLNKIGNVIGLNLDYSQPWEEVANQLSTFIVDNDVDLIVGTSMGGFFANIMGSNFGIPFIMINPSLHPENTLKTRIGENVDYYGRTYNLTEEVVAGYKSINMRPDGCGLLLVDSGDELLDADSTIEQLSPHYRYKSYNGGSHRFDHIKEAIPVIQEFYNINSIMYGMAET